MYTHRHAYTLTHTQTRLIVPRDSLVTELVGLKVGQTSAGREAGMVQTLSSIVIIIRSNIIIISVAPFEELCLPLTVLQIPGLGDDL